MVNENCLFTKMRYGYKKTPLESGGLGHIAYALHPNANGKYY
jgi:hypothetical protein